MSSVGPLPPLQTIAALRQFAAEGPRRGPLAAELFVGREDELEALATAARRIQTASLREIWNVAREEVWLITGAEGAGKSAVIDRIGDRDSSITALCYRADELPLESPAQFASYIAHAVYMSRVTRPAPARRPRGTMRLLVSPPAGNAESTRLALAELELRGALASHGGGALVLAIDGLDRLEAPDSPGRQSTFRWLFSGMHGLKIVTVITSRDFAIAEHAGLDPEAIGRRWFELGPLPPEQVGWWCGNFFLAFDPDELWATVAGIDPRQAEILVGQIQALSRGWPGRVQHCLAAVALEWADALENERSVSVQTIARHSVLKKLPNAVFSPE